ncbi:MAG TPA: EAL domain-containing protein [Candidatus Angelobacter sp.]|nr:EAL domain-containing protein [Candidatus Angelobacter sp.]
MPGTSARRTAIAHALDGLMLALGAAVAVPALVTWRLTGGRLGLTGAVAVVLVLVMARFPLTLAHRSGDVLIGFETCVLVFLTLSRPPLEAFCLWTLGTVIASLTASKPWRIRGFNTGLTVTGGGLFVVVVNAIEAGTDPDLARLGAIMLGCALYFVYDLAITAGSLALEGGCSLGSVVTWGAMPMALACFVSVDTLGFLARVLQDAPRWTLLLLAVPVGTILVAVRSVSENRVAHLRLTGLLEAATHAPDWTDEEHIERSLVVQAERTLRQATASLREEPPAPPEIGAAIELDGRPTRHLVVTPQAAGHRFDEHDRAALEALSAVGVSAFNRRRLSDEMSFLARHDALTGLHNRAFFIERLSMALECRAPRGQVAVLYLDLDGFKEVNDLLGHEAGDRLLMQVAQRINLCLRLEDVAARLGGDEFGILLDDLTGEEQAELVAERLLEALAGSFEVAQRRITVRASIGVAVSGTERTTAERLISSADTAMYAAKSRGKGHVEWFRPEMREAELARLELESALRAAVQADQIHVHYQPVVDLETGRIEGFEALARWTDPKLGAVPPSEFMPAAERLGLVGTLGLQLLERAHAGGRRLTAAAGRQLSIGVNLSAMQVNDPVLAERVGELVALDPTVRVVLELTEGILVGDDAGTLAALHRLREVGARLAVDDFGVGYSSVGYLHRLPVDILKIDKLFAAEVDDPRSRALVEGVVAMARAMDLTVVIEGVEDWASAAVLRDLRCGLAQGFLFSRPVDLATALTLAATGTVDVAPMAGGGLGALAHR